MTTLALAVLLFLPATWAHARVSGSIDPELSRLMTDIHSMNLYEMTLGGLAEKKAASTKVRRYGALLRRDHALADAKLLQVTGELNIDVQRVEPAPEQRRAVARLSRLEGAEFDEAFLRELEKGHAAAMERLRSARVDDEPRVRRLLARLLPIVRQHRELSRLLLHPATTGVWHG